MTNLTCFNSFDMKLKYHTVVHKCFENYVDLRMSFAWLINSYLAFFLHSFFHFCMTTLLQLPCGTKFLRVRIFAIFAVFFAIRKNKFPQNKITANSFSAKTYSTVEIIYKNTGLKEKMP